MKTKGCLILLSIWLVAAAPASLAQMKAEFLLLEKEDRMLTLFNHGVPLRAYRVALGNNPVGHKQQEGDERTPEGTYFIDFKNPHSAFHKSLKISYPNRRDRDRAQREGVSPGGLIMIHGLGERARPHHPVVDWTDGCIAVTNREIDEIWDMVDVDTPILILP